VILGLLTVVYIPKLEFKFKEELQLMPHTEEHHLFSLEEENGNPKAQLADNHNNMDADVAVSLQSEYTENNNCWLNSQ
jgi:hypothetical protein